MTGAENITTGKIWDFLREVLDPEVPVLNVVELGVVRNVELTGEQVLITITPTYTGCPAMKTIEENILQKLHGNGVENVKIKTVLVPAWTTEWLSEESKKKLKEYGIAPPDKVTLDQVLPFLNSEKKPITCPHCGSTDTSMKSFFGSTACKALYVCNDCKEPFDYFKCI